MAVFRMIISKECVEKAKLLYMLFYDICISSIVVSVIVVAPVLFKCIECFVIYNLIRVVIIVAENRNPVVVEMLQDCGGSGCTSALTIFALADNVHTSVIAKEDSAYRDVLNQAAFVFSDGKPVAFLQQKSGIVGAERVAGPDFMQHMFRNTQDGSVSHFFYGSSQETIDSLRKKLTAKYPGINIAGMYSPPFRPLTKEEDEAAIEMINSSGADIVWIGLGAPRQEKWMNAHKGVIKGVMMGVGAGFDFHAGTIKRAPYWIQKVGLEWLYRLTQDPKRLFKRYIVTNAKFVWYLIWGNGKKE